MRRNVAVTRDTFSWRSLSGAQDVERLKASATETELDYRTRPLSATEERTLTLRFAARIAAQCFFFGAVYQILRNANMLIVFNFALPILGIFLLAALYHWMFPKITAHSNVAVAVVTTLAVLALLVIAIQGRQIVDAFINIITDSGFGYLLVMFACVLAVIQATAVVVSGTLFDALVWVERCALVFILALIPGTFRHPYFAYIVLFGLSVLACLFLSHLLCIQYATYLTADENVRHETRTRYRDYLKILPFVTDPHAPEPLQRYIRSHWLVIKLFLVSLLVFVYVRASTRAELGGIAGLIAFCVVAPLSWRLVHRGYSFEQGARATLQALVTFLTYNRHGTQAPGVFHFPTRWLRPVRYRERLLAACCCLVLLSLLSVAAPLPALRRFLEDDQFPPGARIYTKQLRSNEDLLYQHIVKDRVLMAAALPPGQSTENFDQYVQRRGTLTIYVVALTPVLPLLVVFLAVTLVSGGVLCAYQEQLASTDGSQDAQASPDSGPQPNAWDNRIERIVESSNPEEREHFYLGRSLCGDYPVLLHRKLLERHAHIIGSSGSNKTSIGIAPLLTQIMAREEGSIVILDLKGDMALFECARREALSTRIPFKWFTNLTDHSSYLFNPLDQSHIPNLTKNQQTQVALQAMSLEYGEDYGRGYYSAVMESVLAAYLKQFPNVRSFRDLARLMGDKATLQAVGLKERDLIESKTLEVTINRLAMLNALNFTASDLKDRPEVYANRIDLPELFTTSQVIYFYLSAPQEPKTVSMIGKLALFALLSAAAQTQERDRKQIYIFADEFQRLISQNLEIFFEQARSMKIAFILANQDLSQLKGKGVSILSLVQSCTAFKHIFTASDQEMHEILKQFSGEARYHQARWNELADARINPQADDVFDMKNAALANPEGMGKVMVQETEGPRLELNTIIEVSADPLGSFVQFAQNSGFTRYSGYITPIISEYHISQDEYKNRSSTPWPKESAETILVKPDESTRKAWDQGTRPTLTGDAQEEYAIDESIDTRLDKA